MLDMSGFRNMTIAADKVTPAWAAECCVAQLRLRPQRRESPPCLGSVLPWALEDFFSEGASVHS